MSRVWYQTKRYFEKIVALAIAMLLVLFLGLGLYFAGIQLGVLTIVG